MRADKIYLVGFMGAGKTTLAVALGTKLRWRVQDLDAVIERREGARVADIFGSQGEAHFRAAEEAALRSLLPARQVVVATGGGAFMAAENRSLMNRDGVCFWLDVSLTRVTTRLRVGDDRRPLAADRAAMERLFHARQSTYREARVRLDAEHATTSQLVEQVVGWLDERQAS